MNLSDLIPTKKKKKKSEDIAPIISNETKNKAKELVASTPLGKTISSAASKIKNTWDDGYQVGDVSRTILDIKQTPDNYLINKVDQKVDNLITGVQNIDPKSIIKNSQETKNIKNIWDDGFQSGDAIKTAQQATKLLLGTTADVGANWAKGELQTAEGLVDFGRYLTSDVLSLTGNKEAANKVRQNAAQNTTGFIFGENDIYNNPKDNGWLKKLDEHSVAGNALDQLAQSLGQQTFRIGLQSAMSGVGLSEGAIGAFNQAEIFAGSYGTAKSDALANGASNTDATIRGFISGTSEWISENMFDAISGFKTAGFANKTGLKDLIAESTEKAFGKGTGKYIVRALNGLEEGVEEGVSNGLETALTDIVNWINPMYTYAMNEGQGVEQNSKFSDKISKLLVDTFGSTFSKESGEAFLISAISTLITNGMSSGMTNSQRKQVIKEYAKENNISVEKATKLFDGIRDLRAKQITNQNTGYEQRMNTEEQLTRQLAQEYNQATKNGQKLDLEELYKATPKSRKESQFIFTEEERKNIKSAEQKRVAAEMANINNELDVHDTFRGINIAQGINNSVHYHPVTTEGLYQLGFIDKDANGNYTLEGEKYIPRGLTIDGNNIYVNVDVGTKSATQAMFHEMFESFKATSPKQYNQFKQMVVDIVGKEAINKEIAQYEKMYQKTGKKLTNSVRDEIINDKFGELAENQDFINRIANNRSVLEKLIDSIKNMINYVKGTPEEKEFIKLQNKLEKEFAKRYKETDFSQGEGDTAYSLGKHYGDLGKGNDTYYGHMYDSRRSTGHFGTGTYFVDEDYQPGEHSSYANRPVQKVEFDDYDNLFKPADRDAGFDLHDALKEVNYNNTPISKELYDKLLPYYKASFNSYNEVLDEDYENDYRNVRNMLEEAGVETEEPQSYYDSGKGQFGNTYERYLEDKITDVLNNYDRYQKAERDLKRVLGITDEQFNEAIEKVREAEKEYQTHSYDQKLKDDSLSTIFMKTLGYNGIDVRGLEGLDNTAYGSVIYDLDKKTNNVRYSLTSNKDSQGRELSKQQQEYFKDSKVVDENGNLKVMYHGGTSEYNVFDKAKIGSKYNGYSRLGKGFYFTDNIDDAKFWAVWPREINKDKTKIKEVYLNITNPFNADEDYTETLGYLKNEYPNYIDDFNLRAGYRLIKQVNEFSRDLGFDSTELLQRLGYDGIVGFDEVVVFESNQIKNIDNTNPTSNEDIRYSLAPTGEMVDNESNKVEFEVSEVDTELPIRDENKLMVLHNLGENKMNGIMDLDGIPVPSLAITNPYKVDHSGFGEATLIFKKDTIDPSNSLNEVYDRDVWSPTQPQIDYDIKFDDLMDLEDKIYNKHDAIAGTALNRYFDKENLSDNVDRYGIEGTIEEAKNSDELKYIYYKTLNPDFEILKKTDTEDLSSRYSNELLQEFNAQYGKEIPNWMNISDEQRKEVINDFRNYWKPILEARRDEIIAEENAKPEPKRFIIGIAESSVDNNLEWLDSLGGQDKLIEHLHEIQNNGGTREVNDIEGTKEFVNNNINQEEYNKWVDDTLGNLLRNAEKGIYNGKDYITANGRRTFKQTHDKYTLENLVKALTKGDTKGTQQTMVTGYGQIQAQLANQFNSIEEIRNAENQIMSDEEAKTLTEQLHNAINEDIDALADKLDGDYFNMNNASEMIFEYAGKKNRNEETFRKIAKDYANHGIPSELIQKITNDLEQLKNMPTDYFEAKPQRAVGLDEIGIGLIPTTWSDETKQRMRDKGIKFIEYDKSIEGERQRLEKELTDFMFSLTSNQNIDSKEIAPIDSTVEETMAPIREDISNLTDKIEDLSNQIETLQNQAEIPSKIDNTGYIEPYRESSVENYNNALSERDAETYQNALMSDEDYINSVNEMADNYTEPGSVDIQNAIKVSNQVASTLGLSSKQAIELRDRINKYAVEQYTTDEILDDLSKEYGVQSYTETNEQLRDAKKVIRNTPLKVSENIKNDIADYNSFKKSNFGKLNFSRNGIGVDVAYEELANGDLMGLLDRDITNPTDQLLELARIANESNEYEVDVMLEPEALETAADYIHENLLNARMHQQVESLNALNRAIENYEDIAPTTIRTQESIDETIANRDIAPIRQEDIDKQNPKNVNKKSNTWRTFQEAMVNRNYVIDELSKATGNRQVKYKGDAWNNVSSEAQYNINNYQTDNNFNRVGKSVKALFEPAKNTGLYDAFNDYLIQKSNIERTNQGKGSAIPYQVSVQLVAMYENENPQFKTWAKDIYKYFDNVLQDQVDSGLITQEEYDHFRGETGIYRSYVPFYPGEFVASRYFDNEGNLKTPTTLKRSKGGATSILSVEDAMIKQTFAYKNAIRQNDLFNEIVSTLGENDNGVGAELRGNPTDTNMSLFVDPETGDKYVTGYLDGNQYTAKISDELYDELNRTKENQVKELESNLSAITNPLQKASNIRRNLLTSWNPVFLLRNGIKDIQDAMINSKQTGQMLKSYFGIGEKAAILELREGKTKEAQQFLAGYGSEGTYGDYSNDAKSKVISTIQNANELIELAPRFAEFKATLKNGGTIQEALYNAREVTTNFGRGGYIAKAMNRNGFTFLNANIQGLDKLVRNLSGENGAKGVTSVVVKGALFGILPAVLNELAFGGAGDDDKDEEYEALPDYVKDNYYLIKLDSGKFLRIPKGRVLSVLGSAARRTIEYGEGEEDAFNGYLNNAWSQIGVGDSGGLQTIFTPIRQAVKNEAWYGGDIVPTRLQNLPAGEQYDEKTDAVSKKIGELFNISPKKVNYVIDQYSGGIGDILLPMITPATTSGAEGTGYLTAPLKDAFIVNSTDDNKYASEFYTLKDELQIKNNSSKATDEDKLRYKYINSVNSELSELYKERREVQADTTLSKKDKYAKVQAIQNEINSLAKEGIATSKIINQTENYAQIGDREFYLNNENEWAKVPDSDIELTIGMTGAEKSSYFKVKNKISAIPSGDSERKTKITQAVINSGLSNEQKGIVYDKYYSGANASTMATAGLDVDTYIIALDDIDSLRNKYSTKAGYSTAYRKNLTVSYIESLNANAIQKAIIMRQYYTSFNSYNRDIVNYVKNLNISNEEKTEIIKAAKLNIDANGNVSW